MITYSAKFRIQEPLPLLCTSDHVDPWHLQHRLLLLPVPDEMLYLVNILGRYRTTHLTELRLDRRLNASSFLTRSPQQRAIQR